MRSNMEVLLRENVRGMPPTLYPVHGMPCWRKGGWGTVGWGWSGGGTHRLPNQDQDMVSILSYPSPRKDQGPVICGTRPPCEQTHPRENSTFAILWMRVERWFGLRIMNLYWYINKAMVKLLQQCTCHAPLSTKKRRLYTNLKLTNNFTTANCMKNSPTMNLFLQCFLKKIVSEKYTNTLLIPETNFPRREK